MEYFESILENLSEFSEMDAYGHLDYVVRYGPNQNREYSYGRYQDILDEILKTLIRRQVGLEINTGGYHYGLGEPNPCINIIKRYRQLGGEILTIGADAHSPDKIGYGFDLAAEVLKECGFSYYTVFRNRKPEFIPLQ
jgi:histidinol-phosphatase (PHP family)